MLVASSPLCGFNFLIVDTPALPFCHTKGVKSLASQAHCTLGRES